VVVVVAAAAAVAAVAVAELPPGAAAAAVVPRGQAQGQVAPRRVVVAPQAASWAREAPGCSPRVVGARVGPCPPVRRPRDRRT
jgi:hypothetical protein